MRSPTNQFKRGEIDAVDPTFSLLPKADLGNGEILSPGAINALIGYAKMYGLDPYRGHVVIMYGAPYIGLDGYVYSADKQNKPYRLLSRPLNEDERKAYRIEKEKDHAWLATVEKLEGGSFTGLGIVTEAEMTAKSKKDTTQLRSPVVAAHPWQLAQKRAEWQAMRRGFPIGETLGKEEG